jgi:NhaP-type Na+/H+ or K+/H+ antiporter
MTNLGKTRLSMMTLSGLLGIGALGGGWYGLSGAQAVDPAWLAGSPFTDYTIPSLFLLVVIGGGSLATAVAWLRRSRLAPVMTLLIGLILMAWIVAQVAIITLNSPLQPICFAIGAILAGVGGAVLVREPELRNPIAA